MSHERARLSEVLRAIAAGLYMNPVMRWVPSLPRRFRARYLPPTAPWPEHQIAVPRILRSYPGVMRIRHDEDAAFRSAPLQDFAQIHAPAFTWLRGAAWRSFLPVAPRMWRARTAAMRANEERALAGVSLRREALTTENLTTEAARLGISAIGVAPYDERYTFEQWQGAAVGDRIVVCLLEQNFESTQQIASPSAEKAALSTYAELMQRASKLARLLQDHGYRAHVQDPLGRGIAIHYAVEAGLGQLGLNGQLLTPTAGSRCRIILLNTDAPLAFHSPKDFGIPAICDACQICVRRCPPGAIPKDRQNHRGVVKTKINTKRCFPVVAQANGCAVCMKVCPIQRYGLQAVIDEYMRSGEVLGKGTNELEGYVWPIDGRFYGSGEKPRITDDLMSPVGFSLVEQAHASQPVEEHGRTWA